MSDPVFIALTITWLVGSTAAAWAGCGWARAAGIALLVELVVDDVGWRYLGSFNAARPAANFSGIALAVFFLLATFGTRRLWAAVAAGGQLMSVATHVVRPLLLHVQTWAFVTARDLFGFVVLAAVMVGALTERRRRT